MAQGLNKVMLIGYLGGDPEVRTGKNGNLVAWFSLATNEKSRDANGNQVKYTEWHRVVAFGKLAEIVAKYLKKGKLVYVEGRLTSRRLDQGNGVCKWAFNIATRKIIIL